MNVRMLVDSYIEENSNYSPYEKNAVLYAINKLVSRLSKECSEMYRGVRNSFRGEFVADYAKMASQIARLKKEMEESGVFVGCGSDDEEENWRHNGVAKLNLPWECSIDEEIMNNAGRMLQEIKEGLENSRTMMESCRDYEGENAEAVMLQMEREYCRAYWGDDERRLRTMIEKRTAGKEDSDRGREVEIMLMEMEWNARGLEAKWLKDEDIAREMFVNRGKYCGEDYRRLFRFMKSHYVLELEVGASLWTRKPGDEYGSLFVNNGAEEIGMAMIRVIRNRDKHLSVKKYQYVALLFVMIDLGLTPHPASNNGKFTKLLDKHLGIKISSDTVGYIKSKLVGDVRRFGKEETLGKMEFTEAEYEGLRKRYVRYFCLFNRVMEKSVEDGFAKWVFEGERYDWGEIRGLQRLKKIATSAKFRA